jgi:hypothetical protein
MLPQRQDISRCPFDSAARAGMEAIAESGENKSGERQSIAEWQRWAMPWPISGVDDENFKA